MFSRSGWLLAIGFLGGLGFAAVWWITKPSAPSEPRSSGPARAQDSAEQIAPAGKSPIRLTRMKETGIDFRHVSGNSPEKPFPATNGSGAAALDYDLDGRYDLYFASGQPFPLPPRKGRSWNRLYRNLGAWKFADVTEGAGFPNAGYSAGLAVGDYNADGFPDVYVSCFGANRLYENLGDGTFADVSELAGAADEKWGTSAAFLDYDQDGLLDLYVCNYAQWTYEDNRFCGDRERNVRIFCHPQSVRPEPDCLFRNLGDGRFQNVARETPLASRSGRAQGVLAADVNRDGLVDLYVGNDLHPNALFLNMGGGRFQDASEASGAAYSFQGAAQAGMGVAGGDVNGDGFWDLFVTNFERDANTLYLNNHAAIFDDRSRAMGLAAGSQAWVGWGTAFVDFDLDGWKDLIVTNGHVDDNLKLLGRDSPYAQPTIVWRNNRTRFDQLKRGVGSFFEALHPGRGLAAVDLDNDGDTDIVVTLQDQTPALLRNDRSTVSSAGGDSVSLRLVGTQSNRDAVGAVLTVSAGGRVFVEQVQGGGSYLSAHDLRQIVAKAIGSGPLRAEVRWPSGLISTVQGMKFGEHYVIIEPSSSKTFPSVLSLPSP